MSKLAPIPKELIGAVDFMINCEIENLVEFLKEIKYAEELTEQNNTLPSAIKRESTHALRKEAKEVGIKWIHKFITDYKIKDSDELCDKIDSIDSSEIDKRKKDAYEELKDKNE